MNNKGSEALFLASSTCKLRLVRMLVEGGTPVNVRNERLETPLMLCCQAKTDMDDEKGRIVSYLLSKQAKVNLQDIYGRTALIYACMSNSGKEIIKALLDAKSNPWIEDESKNTVFDYVMNAEDLETTRLLINACRESMLADARDNNEVKQLEECLANIQDIRKFSWPLTGPRIRRDHSYLYSAEKEDPSIASANLLGANLSSNGEETQPERRRKRSVCHFDPLDIEEILNCTEEAGKSSKNTEGKQDDKSVSEEKRKTSVRSLSEEERFSFQISDAENAAPRDPSSGLEKLLKLQDSFCSSFDSNEFPFSNDSRRNSEDPNHSSSENQQICDKANSIQGRKSVVSFDAVEKTMETKSGDYIESEEFEKERMEESFNPNIPYETREAVNNNEDQEGRNRERLFTFRVSSVAMSKRESYTTVSESSVQRHVVINSAIDKQFTEGTENRSNRIISPVTGQQPSPVISPSASPQMTRCQTQTSNASKQSSRASPVPVSENNRLQGVPIVRRYTLSAMDMGKFQTSGIKTLLVPLKHPTAVETDTRRGSAVLESTSRGGTGGNFTPPGLRKSKSDLTDRTSMSHSLQGKDIFETGPKLGQNIPALQQLNDHSKERNDVSEFQLPSISSTKLGRRSPKDFIQPMTIINPSVENKSPSADPRIELSLPWRNSGEKPRFHLANQDSSSEEQKQSPSPSRTSLPSSPKDLTISSPSSPCDVIALAKVADLSPRGHDNTSGEVLPDLVFNSLTKFPYSEESGPKQGGSSLVTPQNNAHRRLLPATLLPPLNLSNRRSPTYDLEDGYFSGSPSPADVESPRRKSSSEQQRYSFRPISPRSPIRSPKSFNPHSGKPPQSR